MKKNWKEYLSESIMIIFSVVLGLLLSEEVTRLKDKRQTREIIRNIRAELTNNKTAEEEQYQYQLNVLQRIDSALKNTAYQHKIVVKGEFDLAQIAPEGILYRYLNKSAWEIAKGYNILSKIDIQTAMLLTRIYEDQDRIMKVEDEVAKVLFDRASRRSENIRETLLLMRDNYKGWAVDRAPALLQRYQNAITMLENY